MKKFVFLFLFFSLLVSNIQAQDFYYGPKVGANLSNIMATGGDDFLASNNKFLLSGHIGAFTEIVFSDFLAIQPELLYSVKGARFTDENDDLFKSSYVYKYLSLPILVKYYLTENIILEAGPQVAYMLSAKNVFTDEYSSTNYGDQAASVDLMDSINPFDFGIAAGGGYIFSSGIYIDARYNYGMLNILNKDVHPVGELLQNGSIQLSFGYSLNY